MTEEAVSHPLRRAVIGTRPPSPRTWRSESERAVQQHVYALIAEDVRQTMRSWRDQMLTGAPLVIVSGGALGVDSIAADEVRWVTQVFGAGIFELVECLPDPDLLRVDARMALLARNETICHFADEIHAWPSPWSKGTWHAVKFARRLGKEPVIHKVDVPS
jgi:hypothetical protein